MELDRGIHKELNDTKFYTIWLCLVLIRFENAKWCKMCGIIIGEIEDLIH